MPSLKAIRKRISSVQSTQKITRAMKMVAGARLNKAQVRITELRPYAVKTGEVLARIAAEELALHAGEPEEATPAPERAPAAEAQGAELALYAEPENDERSPLHPLLVKRAEKRVIVLVLTSDRGLCGAFNTNINKRAEREWRTRAAQGQSVELLIVGRKGRDYMTRRGAPIREYLTSVWDKLSYDTAHQLAEKVRALFLANEADAIYIVYNEFKSAMSQAVVLERLLPVPDLPPAAAAEGASPSMPFIFEPHREALLDRLAPMYLTISILRALYESQASELGSRMTAMDAATKNAKEMIEALTLQYNKARQAAITKELMEIIGGSEALKG